jgi:anti-sigma B factor antagonist
MIRAQQVGDALSVALDTELTIYQVGELHAAAQAWLAQPCPWQLDLTQVTEMDGAGLQWLLFVRQHLHAAGHSVVIDAASDAVMAVLALCPGLDLAPAA